MRACGKRGPTKEDKTRAAAAVAKVKKQREKIDAAGSENDERIAELDGGRRMTART
jgi:hypothetical protein